MASSRRAVLTNHNRCWIWGRNVVMETLRAGYWPVLELLHSDRCRPEVRAEAIEMARQLGVKSVPAQDELLDKTCRSENHQGLAARMTPFPYREVNELVEGLPENPVLVLLDRLQDSFNFGAILRSADGLGIHGVIVGTHDQAEVNSLVARSSAGSVNHVPIAQTDDLIACVTALKEKSYQIIGTSDHATDFVFTPDYRQPTLLLIGNEGRGLDRALEALCTCYVQIPMQGQVSSLNAAVSAGILFYEVLRQRR